AFSHMQMRDPSPLRDPHSNRTKEPKDYNILTPLHSDGSDFTCKGYQWNTPLTPVASYKAGGTYELTLGGSATHGGGSCQISLSCDNGVNFKVLKSIIGGCPLQDTYDFTIPDNVQSAQCLLAWTWFNKIGNREMYMNCAVVNIIGARSSKRAVQDAKNAEYATASAQAALRSLPDLYVANLASINSCKTVETVDQVFDNPGADVAYGDNVSPSYSKG
ncbi:lytic polysaccharide monooxygenase, partial [Melanomma pulvis-pyrius CBS 109.77]